MTKNSKLLVGISDFLKSFVRLFFKACGFGDDILGSTTMMYSRKVLTYEESDQLVIRAGQKLLLAPALKETCGILKANNS